VLTDDEALADPTVVLGMFWMTDDEVLPNKLGEAEKL